MFAFKLKAGVAKFLAPMIDVSEVEFEDGVTYYAIVDPALVETIVTEEELRKLEADEKEEFIIFE